MIFKITCFSIFLNFFFDQKNSWLVFGNDFDFQKHLFFELMFFILIIKIHNNW